MLRNYHEALNVVPAFPNQLAVQAVITRPKHQSRETGMQVSGDKVLGIKKEGGVRPTSRGKDITPQ